MTDDRKCDRPKEVCQLVGRYDSSQRGVKVVIYLFQLTERCDGYEGGVRRCGKV